MKKLLLASIFALTSQKAFATTVTLNATADTTLTRNIFIASPAGSNTTLFSVGFSGFESSPLIKFDLSSLINNQVINDGILSLTHLGFNFEPIQNITVSTVKNSWDEATATYSNFNPVANTDQFQSSRLVDVSAFTQGIDTVNFVVPKNTLQNWIDNPAANFGLILTPSGGRDIYFFSRESAFAPTLRFDVAAVPELETYAMMLLGLGFIGFTVRRKCLKFKYLTNLSYKEHKHENI